MGKEQLPKVLIEDLALSVYQLHSHVAKAQALHPLADIPGGFQRHQRAFRGGNGMPQGFCHGIAIPCGAGGGIGKAAGSQNHPPGRICTTLGSYSGNRTFLLENLQYPVVLHMDTGFSQLGFQAVQDGGRAVGNGEHPVAPLHLQGALVLLKKSLDSLRRKLLQSAIQKLSVSGNICHHLLGGAVVGHIAPAFSGNEELLPQPVIPLQKQNLLPPLSRHDGCKHSGRAAADDDAVIPHIWSARLS